MCTNLSYHRKWTGKFTLVIVHYFSTAQSLSKIDVIKRVQHSVKFISGVCGYEVHDIYNNAIIKSSFEDTYEITKSFYCYIKCIYCDCHHYI